MNASFRNHGQTHTNMHPLTTTTLTSLSDVKQNITHTLCSSAFLITLLKHNLVRENTHTNKVAVHSVMPCQGKEVRDM